MSRKYKKPLTLEELKKLDDSEINYSDIPELNEEFWKNAKILRPQVKEQISIRFDKDIIEWFRAQGKGYQTHINSILRAYVDAQKSG